VGRARTQHNRLKRLASLRYLGCMSAMQEELVFEVVQEADGGFVASCLSEDIITEADTRDVLRENVREAVQAFHYDSSTPRRIRLHLVRDELLILA
jgi:predicted RNase H-like HicB family nuclease